MRETENRRRLYLDKSRVLVRIDENVVDWLAELGQKAFDTLHGALVAFDLALPTVDGGIVREVQLHLVSLAESRCVRWGGHELSAGEIQVALAWAFLRQAQAVAQFKLRFEKVGLEPARMAPGRRGK